MAKVSERQSGTATMRPRARLINLIGEELISDEAVAVVELVKNAYDADATEVRVAFENGVDGYPSRIVVSDNGIGMNLETVLGTWLEPGTPNKKRDDRSEGGRIVLGAKGIGRFAAARLGTTLMLETSSEDNSSVVALLLEWGAFTDDGYLDDVNLTYEMWSDEDAPKGTTLTIEGVAEGVWNEEAYRNLRSRLARLVSPFEDVEGFQIILSIPSFEELDGIVEPPEFLLDPTYRLRAALDAHGVASGEMIIDGKSFGVRETLGGVEDSVECGPFEVEIRAWDRDQAGLEPLASRSDLSVAELRKQLNQFAGVSIYRDGFRVHPYGEQGDDWLRLDLRSRQNPVLRLANNQIIASIRLTREQNEGLKDRSTREGMVKNEAHRSLEEWFIRLLRMLEEARYEVRPRRKSVARADALFEQFELGETVQEARRSLGGGHPIVKLLRDTEKRVSEGVSEVQEVFSRLLMSAGLGHMVHVVVHEIGAPLGKAGRELTAVQKQLDKLLEETEFDRVSTRFDRIRGWHEQIVNLRERLDPHTPGKRGRATKFDVGKEIEFAFDLYHALIDKQKIRVELRQPDGAVEARMSKAVFDQVISNLVDNAIFWLSQSRGKDGGGRLTVTVSKLDGGFSVTVADNGQGVAPETKDKIFEPYFSTKPSGIGLGLYIARLLIEPYGRLLLKDKGRLSGATFEARFEKSVGL